MSMKYISFVLTMSLIGCASVSSNNESNDRDPASQGLSYRMNKTRSRLFVAFGKIAKLSRPEDNTAKEKAVKYFEELSFATREFFCRIVPYKSGGRNRINPDNEKQLKAYVLLAMDSYDLFNRSHPIQKGELIGASEGSELSQCFNAFYDDHKSQVESLVQKQGFKQKVRWEKGVAKLNKASQITDQEG